MSEKLDPEEVKEIMGRLFGRITEVTTKYDGFVEKFIGDAVMAIFGVPKAHEDDPVRAILAAREIHDLVYVMSRELGGRIDRALSMHTGINTGLVVTGQFRPGKGNHGALGDTINVASRLMTLASAGEILVGPATRRLAASHFGFEELKAKRMKGKTKPIKAFRVTKKIPFAGASIKPRLGMKPTRIGRDSEIATCVECFNTFMNGKGRILSITGEAGLGKSLMVSELREYAQRVHGHRSILWLEGHTLSFGQSISYLPFQEILSQYAGITDDDCEAEAGKKLQARVTELFGNETKDVFPYLATLLALKVGGDYAERVEYLDAKAIGHQIFLSSRRFFERLAQRQPVALVFEDLHWADESSALLLEHLLPLIDRVPLLICGVSRPATKTPAARVLEIAAKNHVGRYTDVRIGPLREDESVQIVHNLLQVEEVPKRVCDAIVSKADGNPFFIQEIIRSLRDAGAIVPDAADRDRVAATEVNTMSMPDTIQMVVMARVDLLREDLKETLRIASIIGDSFSYQVLRNIMNPNNGLLEQLIELEDAGYILQKHKASEHTYVFAHGLIRESIYENILIRRRRELHLRVAQAIETLYSERIEEFYSLLAHHFARAEAWEKAHAYLLKAGDQAGQLAADTEALTHYQLAFLSCSRFLGDKWEPLQQASLKRKIGEALFRRGEHQQAAEHLQEAFTCLNRSLPTSRREVRFAILREILVQLGHCMLPSLLPAPIDERVNATIKEESNLYEDMMWIDFFSNQERCFLDALRQLNESERSGFPYGIVMGSMVCGATCLFFGFFWLAEHYNRRALSVAERGRNPVVTARAYMGPIGLELYRGNWDVISEYCARAAKETRKAGDLRAWGVVTNVLAYAMAYQGKFARALEYCQELIRLGQEGKDKEVLLWGLYPKGFIQRRMGQLEEAIADLRHAAESSEAIPDYHFRALAGGELGQSYLRQGKLQAAFAEFEATERFCLRYRVRGNTVTPLRNGLAEAYLTAAVETSAGRTERNRWIQKAGRACKAALKQGNIFRPALPEAMLLRGRYDYIKGKRSSALKWWRRSLVLAEEMELRYALGLAHLEIGCQLNEDQALRQAESIFAEIGAEMDLAMTRNALNGGVESTI
jgi:class 3 adenylate cyclase/tetratricopeptide (TPR) repeat protein